MALDDWRDFDYGPEDRLFIYEHLAFTANKIFKSYADVKRLRDASGLRSRSTPTWATARDFARLIFATWGTAAEALALTLYHLAAEEGFSGHDIEHYRDIAEYTWRSVTSPSSSSLTQKSYSSSYHDDSKSRWHKDDDSYEGNPATAKVVFRAVNLARDIAYRRAAQSGSSTSCGSAVPSQTAYRQYKQRRNAPPPYLD